MTVEVHEEASTDLTGYATVPIALEVREVLSVVPSDRGLAGIRLMVQQLVVPYVKDYDADPVNHPTRWRSRFDVTEWGVLGAWVGGVRVGGAVVVWGSAAVDLLEGRKDLAALWDLRVAPRSRGHGIGPALFQAAERWAVARGASWLKAETQNVNVPACRFYASQGCTLGALHRFAYHLLPDEVQLVWYKRLVRALDDSGP
jgi:GNAT superfamily N-acetyltransferase